MDDQINNVTGDRRGVVPTDVNPTLAENTTRNSEGVFDP
ncbi:hypothetical protein DEIPH_ctg009orf0007 [Deinococcus phoenicis]|uniref:Uncharacterized protein n=1 Tax=Deinococcus phoenicis TaxID=1476583 RepID=A0A016QTZ2_9DEIO|nr:hypothetical protein DEIPH_ctg009orf0007 [Deinococcus phoenicis]